MVPTRQCERCRGQVSLDLDGGLSELEAAWMRRHLAVCADCRAFAARVRGATALLRTAPQEAPAEPVVVARVRARSRGMLGAVVGLAATASVAALALTAGLNVSDQTAADGSTQAVVAGNVDLMTLREERIAALHRSLRSEVAGRARPVELY